MSLITLDEAKMRLSIDFNYKDAEIESMINAIEGYLYFATGVDFSTIDNDEKAVNLAKEYVLLKLYLDYYMAHTELDDLRLTQMIKQLQVIAMVI